MSYLLIRQSIKGNAGPTASVLERFYNIHWVNDVSPMQLLTSWWSVNVLRRLSYNVTLTGCDADHPHTMSCSPASCRYIGPPTVTNNTLRNIQTDTSLTSLPDTRHTLTLGWGRRSDASHSRVSERILAIKALHWKPMHTTYATRSSIFPLTTTQSSPAYYARVRIIREILR